MPGDPILLVDDNSISLELTRTLLTKQGYDARSAANEAETMTILQTFRPRLILMDIQLPGTDGLELTRRLKSDPATKDIIIVALTGYTMKSSEDAAIQAGCDGYIAKPIDTHSLNGILRGYLDGRNSVSK